MTLIKLRKKPVAKNTVRLYLDAYPPIYDPITGKSQRKFYLKNDMSSNIETIRICQYCGKEFIAKTTVTRYCSQTCNKKAYKAQLKTKKIEKSNINTRLFKESSIDIINNSAFLTVKESACLLKCSKQMIYNLVNSGRLKSINLL